MSLGDGEEEGPKRSAPISAAVRPLRSRLSRLGNVLAGKQFAPMLIGGVPESELSLPVLCTHRKLAS